MSMTEQDLRSLQEVITRTEREEAELRRVAQERLDAIKASKTPDEMMRDKRVFDEVDEIFKKPDAMRDEIVGLRTRYQDYAKRAGLLQPQREAPVTREALERSVAFNPGGRYSSSEGYQRLRTIPREDPRFVQTFRNMDPIDVVTRDEMRETRLRAITLSGNLPWSDRQPGYVPLPARAVRLLDLISMANTDSSSVEWIQQTARTDVAAAVGYGSLPGSEHAVTMSTVASTVQRIITWLTATESQLSDVGQMEQIINADLIGDYRRSLESLIINGSGTGTLLGIANTSGINVLARGSSTGLDAIHKGITLIRLAFGEPTAVGMHPTDYENDVVLAKDSLGNYLFRMGEPPTVWGMQAVVTPVFSAGTSYVADWTIPTLWNRTSVSIAASNEHSDYFLRGQVAIKAEGRCAFTVKLPQFVTQLTGM